MVGLGFMELVIILGILLILFGLPVAIVVSVLLSNRNGLKNNPHLRPCLDCGQPISVRAMTCPRCGAPAKGG